jgi:hypothetical protein
LGGIQDIRINAVDPVANEIYVDTLTINEIFVTNNFSITDLVPGVTSVSATIDNPSLTVTVNESSHNVTISGSGSGTLTVIIDGGKEILTIPVTIYLV